MTIASDWLEKVRLAPPKPPSPRDCVDLLLEDIFQRADGRFRHEVQCDPNTDYPIVFARDSDGYVGVLYTAEDLGLITIHRGKEGLPCSLTLNGWERYDELTRTRPKGNQAFVAMWFADEMNIAWEQGLQRALEATGFRPIRVDKTEHNEKICDRIVAEIRKSVLLVADVTGHRAGVYFEAGLAMGLGMPVIWTCKVRNRPKGELRYKAIQSHCLDEA